MRIFFSEIDRSKQPHHRIVRREFHGDINKPEMNRNLAFAWIPIFQRATVATSRACKETLEMFESRVNRFGYSLRHARRFHVTPLLEPYLSPALIAEINNSSSSWATEASILIRD